MNEPVPTSSCRYLIPGTTLSVEHRVKDSLFIAHISPSKSREVAEAFVDEIRQKYADATHNCFAYRIGAGDQAEYRFDDDGEPGGSAGRPILQAIESRNVGDVTVVVTRYFGGTKLGVGGLIRAYSGAAFVTLDQIELVEIVPTKRLSISFEFNSTGIIHTILHTRSISILETKYDDKVEISVNVEDDKIEELSLALVDGTRGKVEIK